MTELSPGAIWVHRNSGTEYKIICEARDEGTGIPLVVYQSFANDLIWVRPRSAFMLKFDPLHNHKERKDDQEQ